MKRISLLIVCILLLSVLPMQVAAEQFQNGDFQSARGDMPTGWSIGYGSSAVAGENIRVMQNEYNQKNALWLYDADNTGTAHYRHITVSQSINNLVPGAEYAVTGYSKIINRGTSQGGVIKVSSGGAETSLTAYYSNTGVWEKQTLRFTVPENTTTATVLLRLVGGGELMWADMQLICVKKYISSLETDSVFHYSEQTEGTAEIKINPNLAPECAGGSVSFWIEDGTTTLWTKNVSLSDGGAEESFSPKLLSVKKKAYTLGATLLDADGQDMETQTVRIYRYDRPGMIAQDGTISIHGKEIKPVFAYHVRQKHYVKCAEAGINVIQNAMQGSVEGYVNMLDGALNEKGEPMVYMLLPLYNNMLPAGHPANLPLTKAVAQSNEIRNHPAFFGYLVMDEPFLNLKNPEEYLEQAYTAIREYDDEHPVFIMENHPDKYSVSAKYADILGADIYAGAADGEASASSIVAQNTALGREAAGEKPFWVLLQTFDYLGYFPTPMQLRGQIYQAMLSGADAVGFYKIEKAQNGSDLCDITEIWNLIFGLCTGGEHSLLTEKQEFTKTEDERLLARRWKSGNKQYVQLANCTMQEINAKIPLGVLEPGVCNARVIYGDAVNANVDLKRANLLVTLPTAAAATIELTYTDADCYVTDSESGMLVTDIEKGQTVDIIINGAAITTVDNQLRFAAAFYKGKNVMCDIKIYTKSKEDKIKIENITIPERADTMQVYVWKGSTLFLRLLKLS